MDVLGASPRQLIVAFLVGRLVPRGPAAVAAWVVTTHLGFGALAVWLLSRRRPARLQVTWLRSPQRSAAVVAGLPAIRP